MAVPAFNSVEEADAFLDAPVRALSIEEEQRRILEESNAAVRNPNMLPEPAGPSVVDVAPEDPTPLLQLERPLDGAIEPNVQAVLDENGEPPLPTKDGGPGGPALPQADEDLPPVTGPVPTFATPEDVDAFLDAPDERTAGPAVPTGGAAFSTPEEVDAFLDAEPEQPKQAFEFTGAMGTVAVNGQQVPVGGMVNFDPARLSQGLQGAFDAGLISEEDYQTGMAAAPEVERVTKDREALIKKAQENEKLRAALERRAGDNPELMALLYGAGRGGAMTAGAIGAAKLVGPAAAGVTAMSPAAPLAPVVGLVAGTGAAIVGGVGAGMAYDAVYEQLGRHMEEYDAVLAAAKLKPEWKMGGELGVAALSLPVSGVQAVRGLQTAAAAGGAREVARVAGQAAGAGTVAGAAAVPITAAMTGEPFTAGDVATGAGAGLLLSGFFIGNRRIPDEKVNLILNKQATGQGLSREEAEIFRALEVPMRRLTAGMQAAGGREPQVTFNAAQAGVPGFRQVTGARPEMTYYVPPRLPDAAAARAAAVSAARTGSAPVAPRQAPVNVMPAGREPIVTAPPMTPAMMTPDDFAVTLGTERGIDMDFNPEATTELFNEHFRIVRDAINANQPVSAAALDLYEMRVPYYVRDEATGLAVFDQATFDAWGKYVQGQEREASENMRQGGVDLLEAIRMAGGLPTAAKGKNKAGWSGELRRLQEMARGARDLGIKQARDLFRKDANDVDRVVMALQAEGFKVETEADLFELLEQRLRSGKPMFAYGDGRVGAADEPMAGLARRGTAPRQELPEDLEAEIPLGLSRPQTADRTLRGLDDDAFDNLYRERRDAIIKIEKEIDEAEDPDSILLNRERRQEYARLGNEYRQAELERYRRNQSEVATGVLFQDMLNLSEGQERPGWITTENGQKFAALSEIIASRTPEQRSDAALVESLRELPARIKGDPNFQEVTSWKMERTREAMQKVMAAESAPATPQLTAGTRTAGPAVPTGGTGARRGATPPAASGPAWVPPGVARPSDTTTPRPDWVLRQGETGEGRRLIKGIENYKPGQHWGYRSIVDHVNRAVNLEMKRSTSQTTRSHPAVYRPGNHTAFTRATQSQINFHEAGHGLEFLLDAKAPGFWNQHADELLALTQLPGSMASQPPGNASEATKREYLIGEGVAEWTRLLMVDPPAVQNLKVTAAISAAADQFYPKMAAQLRDAARAVHRFQNKPAIDQWSMANAQPDETISTSKVMQLAIAQGNAVADAVASGAPFSRMGRRILRSILKEWDESMGLEVKAVDKMRQVRKLTDRVQFAHNYKLMVGGETTRAIKGKGLRMLDMDGNFVNLLDYSWRDATRTVSPKHFQRFMEYGWARTALYRYNFFVDRARTARAAGDEEAVQANLAKAQYPLLNEGFGPDKLKEIVTAAEREIPNAQLGYAKIQKYFDTLLHLKLRGGLKSKDEVERMTEQEDYWPLVKQVYGDGNRAGTSSKGDVQSGDMTIKGSQEAIEDLNAVAINKTKQALDAHANNRLMWLLEDVTAKIANDPKVPVLTRTMAGQQVVRLNIPTEAAATPAQIREQVKAAVEKHMKQQMGFQPQLRDEDLKLLDALEFDGIWRPTRPNDANVISYLRGGERRYLLVNDPAMFNFFANKQAMDGVLKALNWMAGPLSENYKRTITQSTPFAVAGLQRDMISQMLLNPDAIGWVPGGSLVQGLWNKLSGKYPQLAQDGLLLSRVEPSSTELMDHLRRSSVMQFLTEGFYVGTSKDPTARALQTWLQPSNYLLYTPLIGFKSQDIVNLVTGGRFLSPLVETGAREGAAAYALKMGAKDEEAAMKYWTSSGQFNEHPLSANLRGMIRPMMFFNPMVQGMRNFAQVLTDPDPAVRGRMAARLIQVAAMSSVGAGATYMWMSEEDKERERERPIEERMGYANVGGFRLAFAYGPEGVVQSVAWNAMMDHLLERPKELGRKEAMLLVNRVFDVGSPLAVFGPQMTALFEAQANFSYFKQKHIVSPWMSALPASEQYYMSTPDFYRKVGKWIDYSPAKIEYIMRQAIGRQADETVKLLESVGGGKPVNLEAAELPFVGRLFARDPMGFGSMSMRKVEEVDATLRQIDTRLAAKGWSTILRNPEFPVDQLPTNELRALHTQLQYLEFLRRGHQIVQNWPSLGGMDKLRQDAKVYGISERYIEEKNMQVLMTRYAQSILSWNADGVEQMESVLKLLDQIPEGTPEQRAWDYEQRIR
jgi:hypothetical protein